MCQDVYMIYTHTITCRCLGEVMDCKDVAGNGVDSCGPATPKGPHPGTSSDGGWINEPGPHLGESSERGPAAVTECNRGDGRADPKPPTPPPRPPGGPTRGLRKRGENCGRPRGHSSPELVRALRGAPSPETSLPPASLPHGPRALRGWRSRISWLRALSGWPSECARESREPSRDAGPSPRELQRLRAVMGRLSHSVTLSSLLFRPMYVDVCVCVGIRIYIHICIYVHIYMYIYICIWRMPCTNRSPCKHTHIHVNMNIHVR